MLGERKINAFLLKLTIFHGSCFAKVWHILITFTGQTFNIWESNNCCLFKLINLFQVWLNTLLLNLWSRLELNWLLDKTWFWFSVETELIKQSWLICLDDIRVYSFWFSGFLDFFNIRCIDNLHWLYNIFADLKFMRSFEFLIFDVLTICTDCITSLLTWSLCKVLNDKCLTFADWKLTPFPYKFQNKFFDVFINPCLC